MNRFLAALALLLLAATGAAAQTNAIWGANRGANPWTVCLYDANQVCQPVLTLPATGGAANNFLGAFEGLTITPTTGTLTIANGKTLTDTSGVGANLLLGSTGGGFTGYGGASSAGNVLTAIGANGAGSFQPYGTTGNSTLVETSSAGLIASSILPTATTSTLGAVSTDGATITNTAGAISCRTATSSLLGCASFGTGLTVTSGVVTPTFGTAANQVAQGGVITAGGPTGSATVAPIITYNAAGQLTTVSSATITPAVGSITGLGSNVRTALGNTLNASGGLVGYSGALGTPISGTLTYATGLPISTGVSGLGTGVAAALAVPAGAVNGLSISYVASITALRAATWTGLTAPVAASLATNWYANDGGGVFVYDAADTTSADNSGTIIVTANGLRFKRQFTGAVNVTWFGAHPDWNGSTGTDNTAAINAAISTLPSATGGKVYLPYVPGVGGSYAFQSISGTGYTNLGLYGDGKGSISNSAASAIGPTTLVCTRTDGGDCINFYDTDHTGLKDLEVVYTSTLYSGVLVDMSGAGFTSGSGYNYLDGVALKSPSFGMTNAEALVRFDSNATVSVRYSDFYGAQYLVLGGSTAGLYGNTIHFDNDTFWNWQYAAIYNPGDYWTFDSCDWEMTSNTGNPAVQNSSGSTVANLSINNSFLSDAGSTQTFILLWNTYGLSLKNNLAWGNSVAGSTFLQLNGTNYAVSVTDGNDIYGFTNVINFIGTATDTVIYGNKFSSDTNVVVNPQNAGNLYSFANLGYPNKVQRVGASGTKLTNSNIALNAAWGSTATFALGNNSRDSLGSITVTPNGTGIANYATVTLTFADGAWSNPPFCFLQSGYGSSISLSVNPPTTTVVGFQLNTVPSAGSPIPFNWQCYDSN